MEDLDARLSALAPVLDRAADEAADPAPRPIPLRPPKPRTDRRPLLVAAAVTVVVGSLAVTYATTARTRPVSVGRIDRSSDAGGLGQPPRDAAQPLVVDLASSRRGIVSTASAARGVPLRDAGRPLTGGQDALALRDRNGRVYYASWKHTDSGGGIPSIRTIAPGGDEDEFLVDDASGFALRHDSVLAYVEGSGTGYRVNQPWVGRVVVRDGGETTAWTRSGAFEVFGWAGDALIVRRRSEHRITTRILRGPGHPPITIANVEPLAIDPAGTRLLVAEQKDPESEPELIPETELRVVDVGSGKPSAVQIQGLPRRLGPALAAQWTDRAVTVALTDPQGRPQLLRIAASGGRLQFARTLDRIGPFVPEQLAVDDATGRIQYLAEGRSPGHYDLGTCERGTCRLTQLPDRAPAQLGFVQNPSRPAG